MERVEYSRKVIQHFLKPKHFGKMKNADVIGTAGNMRCGDTMKIYLKIKNNKIADASFQTFGCAAAIASSDALCELIIGKTITQAKKITNKDIIKHLGGLPKIKIHCSVLGMQTLQSAFKKLNVCKKQTKQKFVNVRL